MGDKRIENKAATIKWSRCPGCKFQPNCELYQRLKVSPSFDTLNAADESLRPLLTEKSQRIKWPRILGWEANVLRVICWYGTLFSSNGEVARYERRAS